MRETKIDPALHKAAIASHVSALNAAMMAAHEGGLRVDLRTWNIGTHIRADTLPVIEVDVALPL